ncbi:hypothetical protein WDU94_012430 [Cyamophila willieti]
MAPHFPLKPYTNDGTQYVDDDNDDDWGNMDIREMQRQNVVLPNKHPRRSLQYSNTHNYCRVSSNSSSGISSSEDEALEAEKIQRPLKRLATPFKSISSPKPSNPPTRTTAPMDEEQMTRRYESQRFSTLKNRYRKLKVKVKLQQRFLSKNKDPASNASFDITDTVHSQSYNPPCHPQRAFHRRNYSPQHPPNYSPCQFRHFPPQQPQNYPPCQFRHFPPQHPPNYPPCQFRHFPPCQLEHYPHIPPSHQRHLPFFNPPTTPEDIDDDVATDDDTIRSPHHHAFVISNGGYASTFHNTPPNTPNTPPNTPNTTHPNTPNNPPSTPNTTHPNTPNNAHTLSTIPVADTTTSHPKTPDTNKQNENNTVSDIPDDDDVILELETSSSSPNDTNHTQSKMMDEVQRLLKYMVGDNEEKDKEWDSISKMKILNNCK